MKVKIDQKVCVGAGNCTQLAAAVFSQRPEDGIVELRQENPPQDLAEAILKAVRNCPTGAISVSEA
jgi:ferredoxin